MRYLLIRYINRALYIDYIDCLLIAHSSPIGWALATDPFLDPCYEWSPKRPVQSSHVLSCLMVLCHAAKPWHCKQYIYIYIHIYICIYIWFIYIYIYVFTTHTYSQYMYMCIYIIIFPKFRLLFLGGSGRHSLWGVGSVARFWYHCILEF